MTNKIVPVVIEATGEVVGTANVSPPDEQGNRYASIDITEPKIVEQYKGLVEVVLEEEKDE